MTYLFAYEANANQTQSTDSIKATVKAAISRHLSEIYGKEKVEQDIDIKIGNLDSRLALPACSDELETELQQRQATSQNLSVRVKCSSGKRWSIYVPARLNIYEQVAVSVRNIRTGEAISSEDYVFKRSNIASLSSQYLAKNDDIADKIAKRPIRSGAILRSGDLKEPLLVKKGETLAVYAQKGALQVTTKAKALSSAKLGQSIKVQNIKSKRIVEARVVGAGTAEAFSW